MKAIRRDLPGLICTIAIASAALGLAACQSTGPTAGPAGPSALPPGPARGPAPPPPTYGQGGVTSRPDTVIPPTATGAPVLGGIRSSDLGRTLDPSDLQRASQVESYALESGQAGAEHRWSNPATGTSGSFVVGDVYQINRTECRDYTHNIVVGGTTRTIRGTACRQPDGTWRSVSS